MDSEGYGRIGDAIGKLIILGVYITGAFAGSLVVIALLLAGLAPGWWIAVPIVVCAVLLRVAFRALVGE